MFRLASGVCLLTAVAFAQSDAEIGGTIRDASGASVPGVSVAVTKVDTRESRATVSNESGFFLLPLLRPGEYRIRLGKAGFKTLNQTGIVLAVNEQARMNFTLDVGGVVEEITVAASVPLLETATASRGQVIDNKKIVELPLNGRDYLQLALISTGAGSVPSGRMNTFSASGQRAYENTYLLDGVDNNTMQRASQARRAEVIKPSVEAIQEFKVLTNAYSAEFGRAGGGVVSVNIKSGSNELHGSLFEFLRNDKFDAKNFFDPAARKRPPFKRNQYGFAVGGPIRRDKTFFFGDWEATRIRESRTVLNSIPTPRQAAGDFAELLPANVIYDPYSYNAATRQRAPYANAAIPAARWDPVGAKLLSFYPKTNLPGITRNFLFNPPAPEDISRGDVRIDHAFSDRDRVYGRYSDSIDKVGSAPDMPGPAWGTNSLGTPFDHSGRAGMLTYNRIFGPTLLMEAKIAWNEIFTARKSQIDHNVNEQLGIKGVDTSIAGMGVFGVAGYTALGIGANVPNLSGSQNRQAIVNLTWIKGAHTLKWGTNLNWLQHFLNNPVNAQGNWNFDGRYTRDTVTLRGGNGAADLLLGAANTGTVTDWVWTDNRRPFYDFYVQDEWRIGRRLTLTPGLRYELHPEWVTRYNRGGNLDFTDRLRPVLKVYSEGSRFNRALVNTDRNDFAPRMGLTYQLGGKSVVRAGYGIYYGNSIGMVVSANNPPFYYGASLTPDPVIPSLFPRDGLPPNLRSPRNASNIGLGATDSNRRSPYNQQWNFTVQHQLPSEILLELGYVGASAHKIRRTYDINTPPPGAGGINNRRPVRNIVVPPDGISVGPLSDIGYETGNANQQYNSLQIRLEKRLARGLSLSGSYMFSKAISDGQGGASIGTTSNGPQDITNFRAERALADEHIKHRFVSSYVYDLPIGKGRTYLGGATGVLGAVTGGWTLAGIATMQSGLRVNLSVRGNPSNTGGTDRPNVAGSWFLDPGQRSIERWFDTSAFVANAPFTYGSVSRNAIGGPPLANFDLALYKQFQLTDRFRTQFRFEAFNATNTPAFDSPNAQVGNPNMGQISGAGRPRNLQLGLKFGF